MDHIIQYLILVFDSGYSLLPYLLVFSFLLVCGLGVPLPEDITLIAAGIVSFYGYGNVYVMIAVSFAGILLGDSIIFFIGSMCGDRIRRISLFKRLIPDDLLNYIEKRLHLHANKVVFMARFMPGLRAPIYFTSGMMKIRYSIFILFDMMAASISVPAIIYCVYYFGDSVDSVLAHLKRINHGLLILSAVVVLAVALHAYLSLRRLRRARLQGADDVTS